MSEQPETALGEIEVTEDRIVNALQTRRPNHAMGTLEMAQRLTGNDTLAASEKGVTELRARIHAVCDALLAMDRLERFITRGQPFYRLPASPSH